MIPTSSSVRNARVLLLIKRATTSSPRTPSDIACRSLTNAASAPAQGYSRDDVLNLLNEVSFVLDANSAQPFPLCFFLMRERRCLDSFRFSQTEAITAQ